MKKEGFIPSGVPLLDYNIEVPLQLIPPARWILQPLNTLHCLVCSMQHTHGLPYWSSICFCRFPCEQLQVLGNMTGLVVVDLSITVGSTSCKQKVEESTMHQHLWTAIDKFSSKHFLGQVCLSLVHFWHYTHGFICQWCRVQHSVTLLCLVAQLFAESASYIKSQWPYTCTCMYMSDSLISCRVYLHPIWPCVYMYM